MKNGLFPAKLRVASSMLASICRVTGQTGPAHCLKRKSFESSGGYENTSAKYGDRALL